VTEEELGVFPAPLKVRSALRFSNCLERASTTGEPSMKPQHLQKRAELFRNLDKSGMPQSACCQAPATRASVNGQALACFTQARALFEEHADERSIAECLSRIAGLLVGGGDLEAALIGWTDAEALYASAGEAERASEMAMREGERWANWKATDALSCFWRARDGFRRLGQARRLHGPMTVSLRR